MSDTLNPTTTTTTTAYTPSPTPTNHPPSPTLSSSMDRPPRGSSTSRILNCTMGHRGLLRCRNQSPRRSCPSSIAPTPSPHIKWGPLRDSWPAAKAEMLFMPSSTRTILSPTILKYTSTLRCFLRLLERTKWMPMAFRLSSAFLLTTTLKLPTSSRKKEATLRRGRQGRIKY